MVNERENGLLMLWSGFVWMNPPYGRALGVWMERMAVHNHGIALIFARTDTQVFARHIFPVCRSLLFLEGRVTFCTPEGLPAKEGHNAGGPSVLIAYGDEADRRLNACRDLGALVRPAG